MAPDTSRYAATTLQGVGAISEALTFDDVLVVPAYSQVLPGEAETRTAVHPRDTAERAARVLSNGHGDGRADGDRDGAMGGIGVIHKNLDPAEQAAQVRRVKKFESGMVVNPLTIHPDQTLAEVRAIMAQWTRSQGRAGGGAGDGPAGRDPDKPGRAVRQRPWRRAGTSS